MRNIRVSPRKFCDIMRKITFCFLRKWANRNKVCIIKIGINKNNVGISKNKIGITKNKVGISNNKVGISKNKVGITKNNVGITKK
jgi:hypothetical protein